MFLFKVRELLMLYLEKLLLRHTQVNSGWNCWKWQRWRGSSSCNLGFKWNDKNSKLSRQHQCLLEIKQLLDCGFVWNSFKSHSHARLWASKKVKVSSYDVLYQQNSWEKYSCNKCLFLAHKSDFAHFVISAVTYSVNHTVGSKWNPASINKTVISLADMTDQTGKTSITLLTSAWIWSTVASDACLFSAMALQTEFLFNKSVI